LKHEGHKEPQRSPRSVATEEWAYGPGATNDFVDRPLWLRRFVRNAKIAKSARTIAKNSFLNVIAATVAVCRLIWATALLTGLSCSALGDLCGETATGTSDPSYYPHLAAVAFADPRSWISFRRASLPSENRSVRICVRFLRCLCDLGVLCVSIDHRGYKGRSTESTTAPEPESHSSIAMLCGGLCGSSCPSCFNNTAEVWKAATRSRRALRPGGPPTHDSRLVSQPANLQQ